MTSVAMDSLLEGQVVHKRKKSRKICFYDVVQQGTGERRGAVMKSWVCGEAEMARAQCGADGRIRVGDVVKFHGRTEEDSDLFDICKFEMVSRFSEAFPGKTFQPLPPSGSSKKDEKQSIR